MGLFLAMYGCVHHCELHRFAADGLASSMLAAPRAYPRIGLESVNGCASLRSRCGCFEMAVLLDLEPC